MPSFVSICLVFSINSLCIIPTQCQCTLWKKITTSYLLDDCKGMDSILSNLSEWRMALGEKLEIQPPRPQLFCHNACFCCCVYWHICLKTCCQKRAPDNCRNNQASTLVLMQISKERGEFLWKTCSTRRIQRGAVHSGMWTNMLRLVGRGCSQIVDGACWNLK